MSIREFQTLETQIYAPLEDGIHVKLVGMMKAEDAFKALEHHLESVGMLPDEYFLPGMFKKGEELPNYYEAICNTNWGGNEGIYLDISLIYRKDNRGDFKFYKFATGKTLGSSGDDFVLMGRIAAECSMMLNGYGALVRVNETNAERERRIDSCVNMVCKYKCYSDEQRSIIRRGLALDLSIEDVKTYANPELSVEEMEKKLADLIKAKGKNSLAEKMENAVARSKEASSGEVTKGDFVKE